MDQYNNHEYAEGIRFQNMGLYPQAFDAFFAVESAGLERSFRKCCEMAWSDQLLERQIERLLWELDQEVKRKNGLAIFNYGLVMEHFKDLTKAKYFFTIAYELKVPQAHDALMRLIMC
jgi:hypothetical protein